jgi:hypothetical protein
MEVLIFVTFYDGMLYAKNQPKLDAIKIKYPIVPCIGDKIVINPEDDGILHEVENRNITPNHIELTVHCQLRDVDYIEDILSNKKRK